MKKLKVRLHYITILGDELEEKEEENSMPSPEEANKRRKTVNLADFLIGEDEDLEKEEDDEDDEEEKEPEQEFKIKSIESTSDSDVIKCGYMKKKAHNRYN